MDILRGEREVKLFKITHAKEKAASLVSEVSHPYIKDLFEDLKRRRTACARRENVPPYIIFSDATLVEFATYLPHSDSEMLKISGVGDLKLSKYGSDFLREIVSYCEKNHLKSRIGLKGPQIKRQTKRNRKGENTFAISLRLFRDGRSIPEIAKERGLKTGTIESHLTSFIPSGEVLVSDLVNPEKLEKIRNAILEMNPENGLAPIKEHLGEDFSYGEIRAVVAELY